MKPMRTLIFAASLPIACFQAPPTEPPPPPAPVAAAPSVAPVPDASAVPAPVATEAEPVTTAATSLTPPKIVPPQSVPARSRTTTSAPSAASRPVTAATTPMTEERPEPVAPPARIRLIVPGGTLLPIEIQTPLSSATNQQGDPVFAVLTEDIPLNGFKLDKGAEVRGVVTTAVAAKRVKGQAQLVVEFDAVMENGEKLSIRTEAIDTLAASTRDKDKKIIAGGAVGGMVLGALKKGKKGAAIGTVLGAAAGTGAVLVMKGDEVEIPRGARLTLTVVR